MVSEHKTRLSTMFLLFMSVMVPFLVPSVIEAQDQRVESKSAELELVRDGFSGIADLYVSPSGLVYVLDSRKHYLYRLDLSTGVVDSLGGRGRGATQFNNPVGIHGTNDLRIVVNDAGNGRIQVFDRRFQPMGQIEYPSGDRSPVAAGGVHVSRDGRVVFWDTGLSRVVGTFPNYEIDALYRPDATQMGQLIGLLRSTAAGFLLIEQGGMRVYRYQDSGRNLGFWQWEEPMLDVRASQQGYVLLTEREIVGLSGVWQPMWRLGHGAGQARMVFPHGQWIYLATDTALYRVKI
jgi:hypothetical protein